ncbi:protein ANTAGONIST OF LIKE HETEROCHROMATIN PROTEIN 1 isoform X2 [Amborella trichopoda]|uniref:protein ANTAGONIST OF LIKE HETEROCHROMATIN PROTEIN 1 isoform X2 n=1 Tax=Amborella trichopoda TaxID=13333 RepID=UPI0005D4041E|nr:protein ANTAGONIST OF LIKE HETEROCHROMATIN PROTEIN 1 isoform X2 [Amborella trichopoda]|eukprot:XP_011621665.1 protein ANTAGONIST OF LIKE HETEROCHROMATIN PROTEIN 1 isoform X2 [Amborella trichopoda]
MAPVKKLKKKKKKKKSKKGAIVAEREKCSSSLPPEAKAVDSDWWQSFCNKNSTPFIPSSGPSLHDEEEERFKHFFRVSKKTFDYICSLVREDLVSRPPLGLINIEGRLLTVEKQVAIAMRRLASGESQVSVGEAFGVGQSTVSQVTWRFIESMEVRACHHLSWPGPTEMEEIKAGFEANLGFPNCCGAIDATHITMTLPAIETSDDWCDSERNYSMLLQVIVDHNLRFLDIVTGWPGSMNLSLILKCSGFFKLCESGERLVGPERVLTILPSRARVREYILGSGAYPLLPWLITPYEERDSFGFNAKHQEARRVAERALLQLKGSWRILHKVMWRPDKHKLPSIILVCCLLHNIMIDGGDGLKEGVALSDHHDLGYKEELSQVVDPQGQALRDDLSKYLS